MQFSQCDCGLVLFSSSNTIIFPSNRIGPTALHNMRPGDRFTLFDRREWHRAHPKKWKLSPWPCWPTAWPSSASIYLEKSTVSTVPWSMVCCDEFMICPRLRNDAKTCWDCDWTSRPPSCAGVQKEDAPWQAKCWIWGGSTICFNFQGPIDPPPVLVETHYEFSLFLWNVRYS